jgi:DNA-binding Lrp family transcriptional regulator
MDASDQRISKAVQKDLPLSERPFEVLAEGLRLDADLLWQRVQSLFEQGAIRRLGASFDSRELGFCSTLAAARVAPALVGRAANEMGRYPEVTHSYLRNHEFNVWFTIMAAAAERIEEVLQEIRSGLSLRPSDVLNPDETAVHVGCTFPGSAVKAGVRRADPSASSPRPGLLRESVCLIQRFSFVRSPPR